MAEAGWYPDPDRANALRYWDGATWTEGRAPREAGSLAQLAPPGLLDRPAPRLIRSRSDAEEIAVEWLRWFGFRDAHSTVAGTDGLVDVRGTAMVAHVQTQLIPAGQPDLRRLHSIAAVERAVSIFFSLNDYTPEGKGWAEEVGIALFRFTHAGEAEPVNSYADAILMRAEHQLPRPEEPESLWWAIPIGCDDQTACDSLQPQQGWFQRPSEWILWVRQGWLPIATFRYDYTFVPVPWGDQFRNQRVQGVSYVPPRGPRREHRIGQAAVAIEMVEGYAVGVPPSAEGMMRVPAWYMNLRPRYAVDDLSEMILKARHEIAITRYNEPPNTVNLHFTPTGTFLMPFFAALIATPNGYRIAVAEGIRGRLDQHLSAHFTRYAPGLLDDLYEGRPVVPA
jgi:Protein of unknown function (DUF2510)